MSNVARERNKFVRAYATLAAKKTLYTNITHQFSFDPETDSGGKNPRGGDMAITHLEEYGQTYPALYQVVSAIPRAQQAALASIGSLFLKRRHCR